MTRYHEILDKTSQLSSVLSLAMAAQFIDLIVIVDSDSIGSDDIT